TSGPTTAAVAQKCLPYFQRAVEADPTHIMAGLNLIEALFGLNQRDAAIAQCRRLLSVLGSSTGYWLPAAGYFSSPHFPPVCDLFRVEWEKAAWAHAGRPIAEAKAKEALIRWRVHGILAEATNDLSHAYEAVACRPDLAPTQTLLGLMLLNARRPKDAVPHLRQANKANPFDCGTAGLLFHALGEAGHALAQRTLARARRLLSKAGSGRLPVEHYMRATPPPGDELASITILCCKQLEYTKHALERLFRHTRQPYEL